MVGLCTHTHRHTIPYKLTARWFRPYEVLSSDGAAVTLDLLETFGKAHRKVNIRRLKFCEERDSCFGPADARPEPLIANEGLPDTKYVRYPMLELTRVSRNCGWSGRDMISLTIVGYIETS